MKYVILITGASSGFGALTARALARAGHTVYGSMRETAGRNQAQVEAADRYAAEHEVDLRTIELEVSSEESCEAAVQAIVTREGRLDVIVHNAGHMVFGPVEAFTPQQLAQLYDVNVLSTHRVNRAALPQLRKQGRGLLVWVSSSSAAGGTPPYLAPYFAAKAGMDALAVVTARELSRWGIETSIIVPGAFTSGTNHFANAGAPADTDRAAEYEAGPYAGFGEQLRRAFAALVPPDADASAVADAIVKVVDAPFGQRPFRVHIDPTQDGAEVVNAVSDRVRAEMLRRIGLADLLVPRDLAMTPKPVTETGCVNPWPPQPQGRDVEAGDSPKTLASTHAPANELRLRGLAGERGRGAPPLAALQQGGFRQASAHRAGRPAAWLRHLLTSAHGPDLDAYPADRLSGEV